MTDAAENLVLEHLRAIRTDIGELKRRVSNIDTELVQQGRLLAILVDGQTHVRGRMAELEMRLDRVEQRLELVSPDT
jgi:tetrahydromethanopterin S-methyltransferase subunit G